MVSQHSLYTVSPGLLPLSRPLMIQRTLEYLYSNLLHPTLFILLYSTTLCWIIFHCTFVIHCTLLPFTKVYCTPPQYTELYFPCPGQNSTKLYCTIVSFTKHSPWSIVLTIYTIVLNRVFFHYCHKLLHYNNVLHYCFVLYLITDAVQPWLFYKQHRFYLLETQYCKTIIRRIYFSPIVTNLFLIFPWFTICPFLLPHKVVSHQD